jgi:hypothetical protein
LSQRFGDVSLRRVKDKLPDESDNLNCTLFFFTCILLSKDFISLRTKKRDFYAEEKSCRKLAGGGTAGGDDVVVHDVQEDALSEECGKAVAGMA